MKYEGFFSKVKGSDQYRDMFKDIIKNQIQILIDQLALAGEESVLLTACVTETVSSDTVGTDVGKQFLHVKTDLLTSFKAFCQTFVKGNILDQTVHDECGSSPLKRKFSEINGEDSLGPSSDNSQTPFQLEKFQMSRSLPGTPIVKTEPLLGIETAHGQITPARVTSSALRGGSSSEVVVPKGFSKCSMCSYMSKFKANVTRHERSKHGINMEGAPLVTYQYTCSMCQYKSEYRSNVHRHEKSVHKILSTAQELESRKVLINQAMTLPVTGGEPVSLNINFGNQSQASDMQTSFQEETEDNQSNWEQEEEEESEEQSSQDGCHICNYCQLMFKSLPDLKNHIDSIHFSANDFKCEKCPESFNNLFSLQTHMISHNAVKQEVCACGKEFQYKTSLKRHQMKCSYLKTGIGPSNEGTSSLSTEDGNSSESQEAVSNRVENSQTNQGENSRTNQGETSRTNQGENSQTNQGETSKTNQGENSQLSAEDPPNKNENNGKIVPAQEMLQEQESDAKQ